MLLNSQNKSGLLVDIALFVFIAQIFLLAEFIRSIMILNTGWGNITPLRLYTIGLPALLVIYKCYKAGRLVMPHFKWFLLLFFGFIFMENLPCRQAQASYSFIDMIPLVGNLLSRPAAGYSFATEQLYLYIYFLILINFVLLFNCFYKIIDYSLIVGILFCVITYMGYLGIVDIDTDFRITQLLHRHQPTGLLINPNNISHVCAFSVLFLIIKQRHEKRFSKYYILRDILIISFLSLMAIINATRGAVINLIILIPYYCFMVWTESNNITDKGILLVLFLLAVIILTPYASRFPLAGRIRIYNEGTAERPVRIDNLSNTWDNFKAHPFIGVGFNLAAKSDIRHGSRSNNNFMQLLASCGIFYFLVFGYYFFRFFLCRLSLLKAPEVCLSFLVVLSHSMIRRPMQMFAIFALIAIYFSCKNNNKNQYI